MFRSIRRYLNILGVPGTARAIASQLTGKTSLYRVERDDCAHPFHLRMPSSDVSTYKQVYLDQEYDFDVSRDPEVIVDAGANIGLASIYFANRYPNARIIALEPETGNFGMLRRNVAKYPNVTPVHAALWNANEEITLVDPGLGDWGFRTESRKDGSSIAGASHKVQAMTVDRVMEEFKLERVDILKVDIEGAECEVFENTLEWLDKVESIIVELHERTKSGCNRAFYCGTEGFDTEWHQGENVYVSRDDYLTAPAA